MNNDTIGLTSKTSAAARANESQRPDALFVDPLAPIYATHDDGAAHENTVPTGNAVGVVVVKETGCCSWRSTFRTKITNTLLGSRVLLNSGLGRLIGVDIKQIYQDIALRTRFLDDIVQKHIIDVKQIVLLACGGDFRPYRLPPLHSESASTDLTFFLLDVPHVLRYRQNCCNLLKSSPSTPFNVVEVPCDLSNEAWTQMLCEANFSISQSTLWLAEGFFHYLNKEQVAVLFNRIRQLSASDQTYIAFDLVSTHFRTSTRRAVSSGLFQFAVDDANEVEQIFSNLGCDEIKCTSFQEIGQKYSRNVSRDRSFIVEAKLKPATT